MAQRTGNRGQSRNTGSRSTRGRGMVDNRYKSFELGPVVHGVPPEQRALPSMDALAQIGLGELSTILIETGVVPSVDALAMQYFQGAQRLLPFPGNSTQMSVGLDELTTANKRELVGLARSMYREIIILDGAEDGVKEWIRMTEGDDRVCEGCEPLGGEIGDYAYHESIGLPGAASCLGGDSCRCTLLPLV